MVDKILQKAFEYPSFMDQRVKMKALDLETIKALIIPILQANEVEHARLFGSFARQEQTEASDVDLLIEFKKEARKSLLDLARLKLALEAVTARRVDLVTPTALRPSLRPFVMQEALEIF